MKKFFCLIFLIITCLSISVCSKSEFFDIRGSIIAPEQNINEQNIKDLVYKYNENRFLFKYPRTGKYKSAIITENFSDSGKDAIVFYQTDTEVAEIHILILHNKDNLWNIVKDIKHIKANISAVNIDDIDGDGLKEIIINWENDNIKDDTSIYKYDGLNVLEIKVPENFDYTKGVENEKNINS